MTAAPGPGREPSTIQAHNCDKFYHRELVVFLPIARSAAARHVVTATGISMRIGGPAGKGPPPNSPVLKSAMQACRKLAPGGPP